MTIDLETIIHVQLVFELCISLVCLVLNLYFASKFQLLEIFHPAFRRVLIASHVMMSMSTTVHPLLLLIPTDWYSVNRGRSQAAAIYYSFTFLHGCLTMFISCKYMFIGLERHIGYKHRLHYEKLDATTGNWILGFGSIVCIVYTTFKCGLSYTFSSEFTSMDERLEFVFISEKNAVAMFCYIGAASYAYLFAVYEFRRLSNYVKTNYYAGSSLAESFTIKQTATIVEVLKPLLTAFAYMMSGCFIAQVAWIYLHYFRDMPMSSPLVQVFLLSEYTLYAFYSIYATMIMIWQFRPMRKLFLDDLRRLCGFQFASAQVANVGADLAAERDHHFRQLDAVWASGPQVKKP